MDNYNETLIGKEKNISEKIEIIKEKTKEYKELEKIEEELKNTLDAKKRKEELENGSKGIKLW